MIKKRSMFLLVMIGLFVLCSLVFASEKNSFSQYSPSMSPLGEKFSADKAYGHIQHLAEKIGPRPAGSPKERQAAQYIYYILEQSGWQVTHQPFSKVVVNPNPLDPEHKVQVINSQNIIAELPGREPETILLGAHYDSADVYAPGALDNASGVGVLLEIARILATENHEKTYQIVFFGAE
ncbi:MAG: M28 family peptidase, partial [Desulfitobacterium sp.]|nr:M28 family peptidase [Desulfitobacterium sp.]